MQDIVFYAAANETLGIVRDYANVRNQSAPVLTLGVSVCLRIRLFAATEGAAPYPLASFNSISDWHWSMDGDFDRSTACKLVADEGNISVHTVTDTVNGETRNFTEFVIPISNMNTQELAAWLGTEKTRSGLTGELVGYDSSENAAFVLQIENFTVRNRVAGLGDPTAMDQEIVTRPQAERMIQTAVSSSAATKQDKLNSANGGTGISVSNTGVISVSNVPQSAVTGLTASLDGISASLAAKQDTLTAGYRMTIVNGATVAQARYFAIEPAITAPANQTTTVVLSAGKAYEIHVVANNAKVLLNREDPVGGSRTFGLEGHAGIFVANTGCIQTGENVVLANALEPDAVNNCTVRFHDGLAIISVEDHVAGYIVTVNAASGAGSLAYGLSTATNEYISVDASLNGQTLDLAGTTTYAGEKHVVGNGYSETVLSGGITCTSKTTFSNLGMNGVSVNGGTMTLGDVYIPYGSTVAVSGGGLAIEKVTGDGGTIDLGGKHITKKNGLASAFGCTFTGGIASGSGDELNGGFMFVSGGAFTASSCTFVGNSAPGGLGGVFFVFSGAAVELTSCTVSGNLGANGGGFSNYGYVRLVDCEITSNTGTGLSNMDSASVADISSCTITGNSAKDLRAANGVTNLTDCTVGIVSCGASLTLAGSNVVQQVVSASASGTVLLTSGAILDLTGNTNATPIAPGGGITFASGGATVKVGDSTASSSYMMDNVTLPAGAKLTNTAVVNLGGTHVVVSSGGSTTIHGATLTGGSGGGAPEGGAIFNSHGRLFVSESVISGNTLPLTGNYYGGGIRTDGDADVVSCTISGNTAQFGNDFFVAGGTAIVRDSIVGDACVFGTNLVLTGSNTIAKVTYFVSSGTVTISSGASITLTSSIVPGGGITIPAGAVVTIIGSGGSSAYLSELALTGSTITNQPAVLGATVTIPANGETYDVHFADGTSSTYTGGATERQEVLDGAVVYIGAQ